MSAPNVTCASLLELPAACSLLLLLAAVALAKFLRPLAFHSWNTVSGGSLQEICDGAWWAVVTPAVVHADVPHFLYNAFFFAAYACPLERLVGSWPLVCMFFSSHAFGFLFKTLLNQLLMPETYMFISGLGCSSSTYFFAFFILLAAHPNTSVAPFGHALVCLALTYIVPPSAPHLLSRTGDSCCFNMSAAAALSSSLLLLCACITHFLPPTLLLSSYITLHFSAQILLRLATRCRNRYRRRPHHDGADHTLHLVCASTGAAFALASRPLPNAYPQLLQLALLWLLLALRVFIRDFPL